MSIKNNRLWQFLSSVKLALSIIFIVAAVSVIGTVVEQKKAPAFYIEAYGEAAAQVMATLGLTNMYSSWWFTALLMLFALNLVVCSIERLPGVWRMVVLDNLDIDPAQLRKMGLTHDIDTRQTPTAAAELVRQELAASGWKKSRQVEQDGAWLLFVQQGNWTRLGVYLVHLSILIVLTGAIVGTLFGFQAYVYLPEDRETDRVFLQKNGEPVPLGFNLSSGSAQKSYYPNGMIREYRTDLTVVDPQRPEPVHKSIVVNDPLAYRGISFYLGDHLPLDEFYITIRNRTTGAEQTFRAPPEREFAWPEGGTRARIDELSRDADGFVQQARISLSADAALAASDFWVRDQGTADISQAGQDFSVTFEQIQSTLLLVKKDPGVNLVYTGSILMVIGLVISFFMSHRRIWISIAAQGKQGTRILLVGTSNKQKPAFEKRFQELVAHFAKDTPLTARSGKQKR